MDLGPDRPTDVTPPAGETVNKGTAYTAAQQEATAQEYTFEGWYWDDEYKLAWNFDTDTVTGDMYLVAKWAEKDAAGAAQSESGAAG